MAVPWLGRLVAGYRGGPGSRLVGFVDKEALGFFCPSFSVSPVNIIPPWVSVLIIGGLNNRHVVSCRLFYDAFSDTLVVAVQRHSLAPSTWTTATTTMLRSLLTGNEWNDGGARKAYWDKSRTNISLSNKEEDTFRATDERWMICLGSIRSTELREKIPVSLLSEAS
jgi:hypothetical protein